MDYRIEFVLNGEKVAIYIGGPIKAGDAPSEEKLQKALRETAKVTKETVYKASSM